MLKKGIYEHIINESLEKDIEESEKCNLVCKCDSIDTAESPEILAHYLANVIRKKLEDTEEQQDRVALINGILQQAGIEPINKVVNDPSLLTEVMSKETKLFQKKSNTETVRPLSGFRVSNLFTGGNSKLSLGDEIRREIASANEICLIVSFLKVSGIRIILEDLKKFCDKEGNRLRIITTTYCGVTQAKAIEQLMELPRTEIRISYNTSIERLHAKSYIFIRNSGMNTAYIGSSNLSKSAQTDGLEWNIRVTNVENPHIIKTAIATFEMYWNSKSFEDIRDGGIKKFNEELKNNISTRDANKSIIQLYTLFPHQKQILEKLKVEREELNNYKNLVVAATGTGKTVISAFDYREFCRTHASHKILFTAHREEILRQSINTYRSVLEDANFGSLWVGNMTPQNDEDFQCIFVSISMLNSQFENVFKYLPKDYYDYIVIDEAHHSQADSYRKLLNHFTPKILLGLTATPERMDGRDLRPDFGGHISAEIRLPQALQAGLLTPFQYFCVSDLTDLSDNSLWSGQKYNNNKLSEKLCNRERSKCIIDALRKYLADEHACRALCFCSNKKHAEYMAKQLCDNGFNAESLTSDTLPVERKQLAHDLRDGKINYLCVVDIFNEGVDIPEVDTVLFLRPTDSLTVFLQQLGRGLRLSVGKTELTVLDFVAQVNRKYDYASRFRSLTLNPEKNIRKQIIDGFNILPLGCSITMEKIARQHILENIQKAIYNKNRIIKEINSYSTIPTISQFLDNNSQDIKIIYHGKNCWSSLLKAAGRANYIDDDITKRLENGMANLIHYNSASLLRFIADYANGGIEYKKKGNETYALILYYALFQDKISKTRFIDIYEALSVLKDVKYTLFYKEIKEIVEYLLANLKIKTLPIFENTMSKMELYGCYTREEIFTLVGRQTAECKMQGSASGVFDLNECNATLLFVTLNKSDKDFSPTTQYDDYLINEKYFHWQSQNKDSHYNRGGKRYTEQAQTNKQIILFVREEKKDGYGNTCPFHCFGPVDYVESQGDFPMNVKWRLKEPVMAQYLKAI